MSPRAAAYPLLLTAVMLLVGCGRRETSSAVGPDGVKVNRELQGKVEIDGSSTVFPISEAMASGFQQRYPNVSVSVGVSGTGGGFKSFTQGQTDISDASRPIKADEFQAAGEAGVAFIEVPIAYDGLTLIVHKDNDWIDHLTLDEVKQIFQDASAAKTWSDVRPGWPQSEIKVFAPGTDSGTFDYFMEVVADEGALRSDMSTSEDDNVLVTGVAGSPTAIGFFGVAYYQENAGKLKAVPVVNPETGEAVLPTPETIESGDYAPFSRPLFIYVNVNSMRRPEVKRFLEFYLDEAAEVAPRTGYVPLPAELYERAEQNVQQRKAGTHYLIEDGAKRSGPLAEVYVAENLLQNP